MLLKEGDMAAACGDRRGGTGGVIAGGDGGEALFNLVGPEVYRHNAFRLLGLPVDATAREVTRRLQAARIQSRLGAGAGQVSGAALPLVPAPDEGALRGAAGRLRDPQSRFLEELFWPWPLRPAEAGQLDEAIAALERGDVAGALGAWEAAIRAASPDSGVAAHNLAVIYHALALDLERLSEGGALSPQQVKQKGSYWSQALARWREALGDEGFWAALEARALALGDPRLGREAVSGLREALPAAILSVNARLAARAAQGGDLGQAGHHAGLARDCGVGADHVERALLMAAEPARGAMRVVSAAADREADADPGRGAEAAGRLMDAVGPSLAVLDALLPPGHPVLVAHHDEVAGRVLRFQVAYAKKTDDWAASLDLLKRALPLARGDEARKRLGENIGIVESNLRLSRCWFCESEKPDEAAGIKVAMHRVISRTPVFGATRVQWRTIEAVVPRCRRCKAVHARRGRASALGCLGAVLLGLGGGALGIALRLPWVAVGWFFAALIFGIVLVETHGSILLGAAGRGVKPEASQVDFPGIKRLRAEGWSVGQKPSGV